MALEEARGCSSGCYGKRLSRRYAGTHPDIQCPAPAQRAVGSRPRAALGVRIQKCETAFNSSNMKRPSHRGIAIARKAKGRSLNIQSCMGNIRADHLSWVLGKSASEAKAAVWMSAPAMWHI